MPDAPVTPTPAPSPPVAPAPVAPTPAPTPPVSSNETLILGKFKSQEDLANAYKALEARLGQQPPAPSPTPAAPSEPGKELKIGGEPLPPTATPLEVIQRAGLKPEDIATQWNKDGKLTDEQYAAIQRADSRLAKLDPQEARQFINLQVESEKNRATARFESLNRAKNAVFTTLGGEDKARALLLEAERFIPDPADRKLYQAMLNNEQTAAATAKVLKQMHADWIGAGGSKPIQSGTPAPSGPTQKPKTFAEYRAIEQQAINAANTGDRARALAILADVDISSLT